MSPTHKVCGGQVLMEVRQEPWRTEQLRALRSYAQPPRQWPYLVCQRCRAYHRLADLTATVWRHLGKYGEPWDPPPYRRSQTVGG